MDLYVKMLVDNGLEPNDVPYSGQQIIWDNALVNNQSIQQTTNSNIIYATLFGTPGQNQIPTIMKYSEDFNASYTATTDDETVITVTDLQGAKIVQIIKEIKPLKDTEFVFNSTAGTITLVSSSLATGETLAIIYKKIINY